MSTPPHRAKTDLQRMCFSSFQTASGSLSTISSWLICSLSTLVCKPLCQIIMRVGSLNSSPTKLFELMEHTGDPLPLAILKYKSISGVAIEDHDWPEDIKTQIRSVNIEQWLTKHPHDRVDELLRGLVIAIRSDNPDAEFLGLGYCFGGKHVFRMAKQYLKAAASFHPVSGRIFRA
jgi:hypothetical protein